MKCRSCRRNGEVREAFKKVTFPRFPWIYYVCKRCGKANRPENFLNPKQRGNKKTLRIAHEIVSRYRESSEQIKFSILVWGPGSGNEEAREIYNKRKEISHRLNERGMNAFFSEDIQPLKDSLGKLVPFDVSEMLQVNQIDLVINVVGSPGSLLEAQKINTKLLHRCLIWLPEAAKGGFASAMIGFLENLGLGPLYFNDSDIKACVLALSAEDWVEGLRVNEIGLELETKMIQDVRIRRDGGRLQ
jgi:hypothetical protein